MHQTTVRFSAELWQLLEAEARHAGISVAQYLREAALARLAYSAGTRGEDLFEPARRMSSAADEAAAKALDEQDSSAALWAQSRLARDRARQLREEAEAKRRAHI